MPDDIDHCAEATRLKALREQIILGGKPIRIRENEREVQYGAADLGRLDALIAEHENACAAATSAPRRRFAKRMRFRRN